MSETKPYPPSFLDRFMNWIKSLPIPYWLTYLLLFTLQSLIFHILSWLDGWIPRYTFNAMILLFPTWQWLTLLAVTHLNSVAEETLSTFSPLLNTDEDGLKKIKYEFTHMPTNHVLGSVLFWAAAYIPVVLFTTYPLLISYGIGKAFWAIVMIEGLLCYSIGSIIYYHSVRQLLLVNRAVKQVGRFNLFQLEPVYAFSRLTARTGISWILLLSLTLLLFPLELGNGVLFGIYFIQILMAGGAFVLPLWFVHGRLVAEKRKLISELNLRVQGAIQRLNNALKMDEKDDMDHFSNALMGLGAERDVLKDIPTWPWRAGTLTGFLSAIVLPIVLFLIQYVIEKWLSG